MVREKEHKVQNFKNYDKTQFPRIFYFLPILLFSACKNVMEEKAAAARVL